MNATYSRVAATSPACTAAPYPGTCSVDHARARACRATSAVPSVDPLSTTMTANAAGTAREQVAQRGRLVPAREDQVADGVHVVTRRERSDAPVRRSTLTKP